MHSRVGTQFGRINNLKFRGNENNNKIVQNGLYIAKIEDNQGKNGLKN